MKRALAVVAVLAVVGLAGLGLVAWREGPRLLEHGIRYTARLLGYRDVVVEVTAVGLRECRLARFTAGPAPGLALEEIVVGYRPRQLLQARVGQVTIASAVLHGVWGEEGIAFPVLPPGEEGPWLAPLPFERLELARARVELGGAKGPVTVRIRDVDLGAPPGERIRARAKVVVERPAGALDGDLDLVVDGDRVSGQASVRSKDGRLELVADLGAPGPAPGRFPDVAGPEALKLAGRIAVTAKEADLSPLAPSLTAEGQVDVALADGRLRLNGDGLDLAGFGLELSGLDLAVALDGLSPPVAAPGQRVELARLRAGVDLGGGAVRFGLRPGGVVDVQSLDWKLYGGRLVSVARYDPSAERNEVVLGVGEVDLGRLVAALGREDLEITGTISGELPIRIEGDRIFADGGRLTASEAGGVIRYQPGGPAEPGAAPAPPQAGIGLVVDALRNFHYRTLQASVEGELTGEMVLAIRLEGSNPDLYDGYPFQLNLNLEGPLAAVVRGSTTGFRIQDAIEKRFQERGEKR